MQSMWPFVDSSEFVKCQPQISAGHYLILRGAGGLLVTATVRFEFQTSRGPGGVDDCAVHSCLSAMAPDSALCVVHV